ncbi:hypothetical protein ACFFX0_20005 [Citricoccus parietis]|uniref:Uncharacterized protein n=1 Tax=Citricoccus parietis TaxID=592307 RepID=A0ABV5G340_9MICC
MGGRILPRLGSALELLNLEVESGPILGVTHEYSGHFRPAVEGVRRSGPRAPRPGGAGAGTRRRRRACRH